MKKLTNRKNPKELSCHSHTFFLGNKNEIWWYTDWTTNRNYARGLFNYDPSTETFRDDEWFSISKADIKDEEAQMNTEKKICAYFGWYARERKLF